jgi:hypothetical protein
MPHMARVGSGRILPPEAAGTFARIVARHLGRAVTSGSGTLRGVGCEHRATSIDSITLGDGDHQGERSPSRRSVLEQSLQHGPLKARRTAFSVVLAIFWRTRGEVQQTEAVAPGHDPYESSRAACRMVLLCVRQAIPLRTPTGITYD